MMINDKNKEMFYNRLKTPPYKFMDGSVEYASCHINPDGSEGGMVGDGSIVENTCWVDPEAEVYNYAQVRGKVHISPGASVSGFAIVVGDVRLLPGATVGGDAEITANKKPIDVGYDCFISSGKWNNKNIEDYWVKDCWKQ